MADKKYICGIDLDGTLLDDDRRIPPEAVSNLRDALLKFGNNSYLCTCTGNDLTFTKSALPAEIFNLFDAHVLEMGCTVSHDGINEVSYVNPKTQDFMRSLEPELKRTPDTYIERRLATVTLFANKATPDSVGKIADYVRDFIEERGLGKRVYYRCSNIAVDIVPIGFSKFAGISKLAERLGVNGTIGIADSAGDIELLRSSTYSAIPSNATKELFETISGSEFPKRLQPVSSAYAASVTDVLVSNGPHTEGITEILEFLRVALFQGEGEAEQN